MPPRTSTTLLKNSDQIGNWGDTRSGRLLQDIRRDMDMKNQLFRNRRRNEEVLSLVYQDGTSMGGGGASTSIGGDADWKRIRENALNLPYRYVRWLESQATSKRMVVKVSRDAGAGQIPGGPSDDATGMWQGISLSRVATRAGYKREMKALIGEVAARGTSVMRIGYHEEAISLEQAREVGKDPQSVVADALTGEVDAIEGQDHAAISRGLGDIAQDENFKLSAGQQGVQDVLTRKSAHDQAAFQDETNEKPTESTRMIRRKIWMRKKRVGEDAGWAPWVNDVEDTPWMWERHVWTVAQVKAADHLFTAKFRREVEGFDGRNVSGVFRGAQTPGTESMGSDARIAQSESVLDEDERMVEWFEVWFRRPDMQAGGIRKIVSSETPDVFVEKDDSNPHVDDDGRPLIPNFYPLFDFTPILSTLPVPERTCGIPPVAVGMTQFEKIAEYNRLIHEAALRHSLRLYQIDPALKSNSKLLNALRNGEDGFAFVASASQVETQSGKIRPGVVPVQFSGNTNEVVQQKSLEESDWVKVQAMPPAVLQGVGTAETATQDQQGIAAGERESGAIINYFEERMADVLAGVRGLMRGNLDDEDFIRMLGEEGAAVMKAWQGGSVDDGDEIEVTFGARAQAQEVVDRKQLMEAITLLASQVDPVTGLPLYDILPLIEELHRSLSLGAPKSNDSVLAQLQKMVKGLQKLYFDETGIDPLDPESIASAQKEADTQTKGGPNPSEGDGPTQGNLNAGAGRGTVAPEPVPAGAGSSS